MALTSALLANQRTLYLTASKSLSKQVSSEMEAIGVFEIHGHNNYRCFSLYEPCHTEYCAWDKDLKKARQSKIVLSNDYNYFHMVLQGKEHLLGKFDLIIFDEAHRIHDILCECLSVSLDKHNLERYLRVSNFPTSNHLPTWVEWARFITLELEGRKSDLHYQAYRYLADLYKIESIPLDSEWYIEQTDSSVSFRPIWAKPFAAQMIDGISHVLLMSATLNPKHLELLSIPSNSSSTEWISLPCPFPVQNRPFYYLDLKPQIRVKYNTSELLKEELVRRSKKIIIDRINRNGLFHSRSYGWAKYLTEQLSDNSGLLEIITHSHSELLNIAAKEFKSHKDKGGALLISPSISEGHDFPDGYANYQIILKVPYIDKHNDPVMKIRCESDPTYEIWSIVNTLQQTYGRTNRSSTQRSETFMLDAGWLDFIKRHGGKFDPYFREAWKVVKDVPKPISLGH